jgi:hypothetical protein
MLYWCVYTLDRRWSFGTELPFAVHDSEIDRHPMLDVSNNKAHKCLEVRSLTDELGRLTFYILRFEHGLLLPNLIRCEEMATGTDKWLYV